VQLLHAARAQCRQRNYLILWRQANQLTGDKEDNRVGYIYMLHLVSVTCVRNCCYVLRVVDIAMGSRLAAVSKDGEHCVEDDSRLWLTG